MLAQAPAGSALCICDGGDGGEEELSHPQGSVEDAVSPVTFGPDSNSQHGGSLP